VSRVSSFSTFRLYKKKEFSEVKCKRNFIFQLNNYRDREYTPVKRSNTAERYYHQSVLFLPERPEWHTDCSYWHHCFDLPATNQAFQRITQAWPRSICITPLEQQHQQQHQQQSLSSSGRTLARSYAGTYMYLWTSKHFWLTCMLIADSMADCRC